MNENNSMAYSQNNAAPNDNTQSTSVYAQNNIAQNNPTPVAENDPITIQYNAAQTSIIHFNWLSVSRLLFCLRLFLVFGLGARLS